MVSRMFNRRFFLFGVAALASTDALADPAPAKKSKAFKLDKRYLPQLVDFPLEQDIGTVVVDPKSRFLYLVETVGVARRYGIGVGKAGLAFKGQAMVGRKAEWPRWKPTANMIKRDPEKYLRFADGLPGGKSNPLGARALYLYRDGRDTLYRIHGTTEPWTIGKAVSNGCIRMVNDHVIDLYNRVPVGASVVVV